MAGERLPLGLGGGEVWRSDRGVHRDTGPWTPTVHALLRHLETVGFHGSPRVLGFDAEGREVLSYLDGDVLAAGSTWRLGDPTPWPDWARSEDCLTATARLLRGFHDAAASFEPPAGAVWRRTPRRGLAPDERVCHGDIGPHNTVYQSGRPVAFIDWDTIRPEDPIVEFGAALWKYVPLATDETFSRTEFGQPPNLRRRVALFARAYGVEDPAKVSWALIQAKVRSASALGFFDVTPAETAASLRIYAGELEWLDRVVTSLVSDLA